MTNLSVSIIVCTHNRAALLPKILDQLCNQEYPSESFEIIIVDNASTDDTSEAVQRFVSSRNLTLRLIQESRLGVTFARNRGAEEARYPYLAYLDDDCSVGRDWLSQLVSGFELGDQVSVVAGSVLLALDGQKMPAWLGPRSRKWLAEFTFPGALPRLLENPSYVCEGNMAIKKQVWRKVGGFLGMDRLGSPHMASQEIVYLLEQVKRGGGKVAFVPAAVAHHHTVLPTWRQLVLRAYFHGVSTAILDHLLKRFFGASAFLHLVMDFAALFIFLFLSLLYLLMRNLAAANDAFVRAVSRLGKVLSQLHLAGDWRRVRQWLAEKGEIHAHLLGRNVS